LKNNLHNLLKHNNIFTEISLIKQQNGIFDVYSIGTTGSSPPGDELMVFIPRFSITNSMTSALTKIERARGFIEAAKLSEDWIAQMQNRAFIREAHFTTHIEGTHLTLEQSEKLLAGKKVPETNPDDVRELLNYRQAFDLVSGYIGNGQPLTEGLIREIHRRLVQGVRGNSAAPGEYRKIQNYVVNATTGETVYIPPSANDVPHLMAELVKWLNTTQEVSPIIVAGVAQFQIVHIHPFLDGNGRTARLLSTLCLYRNGYDFKRLFIISELYDRDRSRYYRALQSVREHGMDLTNWLEYFTEGLATQMHEVQERGKRVIRRDVLLSKARKLGLKERPISVFAFLIDQGKGTITECEAALKINRRTLQRDLKLLIGLGFVEEISTNPTDPTKYYKPLL